MSLTLLSSHNDRLISGLQKLSEAVFARSMADCDDDVRIINESFGLKAGTNAAFVEGIRPKFFTGDPTAIRDRNYLLVVSLNYKHERQDGRGSTVRAAQEEYTLLNRGAAEHYNVCANHFSHHRTAHPFFFRFSPILSGFTGTTLPRDKASRQRLLRDHLFFMEAIPLFSIQTRTIRSMPPAANATSVLKQNRTAFRLVLAEIPPIAILLNGTAAAYVLNLVSNHQQLSEFIPKSLVSTTRRRGMGELTCKYEEAEFLTENGRAIPVFRCNFVRSIHGPNSTEQRLELGTLIRKACTS